jgi:hypothetical protein
MYRNYSGGRVGRSPYRDHNISKIILVSSGLDMPFAIAQGYSTTGNFYK